MASKNSRLTEPTCKICGLKSSLSGLGVHVSRTHGMTTRAYYDKFYKQKGDGRCEVCGAETKYVDLGVAYTKFCSISCQMVSRYNDPEFMSYWKSKKSADGKAFAKTEKGKEHHAARGQALSEIMKRLHRDDPEWKARNIKAHSVGLKKAWKDPQWREQMAEKQKAARSTPAYRKRRSELTRAMLEDPTSKFGHRNGIVHEYRGHRLRSSWELKLAQYLDQHGIEWEYEAYYFEYDEGRRYTPDFFIPHLNLFVEVKPHVFAKSAQALKLGRLVIAQGYQFKFMTDHNCRKIQRLLRS